MISQVGPMPGVVLACGNNLGESVLWDEQVQRLVWVNIHEGEAWSWSPLYGGKPQVRSLGDRVGAIGLRSTGGLVAALPSSVMRLDAQFRAVGPVADVEGELETTRLNDGRVDPAGRFVCGGMDEGNPQRPISAVYSFEADGSSRLLVSDVACANSICWSPDGSVLYFTDMPSRRIDAFDYDVASGTVSNRRMFADLRDEPGLADGSVVDAEGFVWNAQWGGSKIVRYAPDGRVDREVAFPVSNPTCLAFGGPDLDVLFVTTAWFGLSEAQRAAEPAAGHLFALRPSVRGRAECRFSG